MQFQFTDSVFRIIDSLPREPQATQDRWLVPPRTGLVSFDSITTALGGATAIHVQTIPKVFNAVTVYFRMPLNVPGVMKAYAALRPGIVRSPLQDIVIGVPDRLAIQATDSVWEVTMSAGWGDCLSGCYAHHLWRFHYRPIKGDINLVSDSGPPVPSDRGSY